MIRSILFTILALTGLGTMAQTVEKDVRYLADDRLMGREVGTEGERMAGEFIINRFRELGLQPKGTDGYWQVFSRKAAADPHSAAPADAEPISVRNVVAYIDNKADRTVVIGAHYDHLGMGQHGSLNTGQPDIHNGADDNASGVALLLWLAEKLSKQGIATGENYLFIAFSGEERGLWGSAHFTREPTIDLSKVSYMLNFDMVGRLNAERSLAIGGTGTSPIWKRVLDDVTKGRFKTVLTESGVGPSDHTSFYLKDIPVMHFFTGQHEDYHKPSDDADKVNINGIIEVGQFALDIIVRARAEGRPAFSKTKDEDKDSNPKFTVTLGVVPDYLFDGKGMRIAGVKDDKPAHRAGLLKDDIVIGLGKMKVIDMQSYMKALASFKKGDIAKVTYLRGGKKKKSEVVF
jgi:hypothetical protein